MGLSIPQIYDLFIRLGLIRRSMHSDTFRTLVEDLFGSIKNVYKEFTEGTIGLFEEAGYVNPFIYDEYMHYYSIARPLVIPKTLDVPKFLTYTMLGYSIKSIAPFLKLSSVQLTDLCINYIDMNFKEIDSNGRVSWLIPITSRSGRRFGRPFFIDLQNFLIAPIALYYHSEGLYLEQIASLFKRDPFDSGGYAVRTIRNLFRNIFHAGVDSIDYRSSLQEIRDIVLHFELGSLSALGRQFSLSYTALISRVHNFVVSKKEGFEIIDQFKISIIGPLLYNLYKVRLTPIQIAKHNAFFWEDCQVLNENDPNYNLKLDLATQKVISYTQLIFQCAPHQVTSNFLSDDDYRERFGVIPFDI